MLLATPAYAKEVNLYWDANDPPENVTRYHVYRSMVQGTDYRPVTMVEGPFPLLLAPVTQKPYVTVKTQLPDDGLTYYFVIRAFNGEAETVNSNEVVIKTRKLSPVQNAREVP